MPYIWDFIGKRRVKCRLSGSIKIKSAARVKRRLQECVHALTKSSSSIYLFILWGVPPPLPALPVNTDTRVNDQTLKAIELIAVNSGG